MRAVSVDLQNHIASAQSVAVVDLYEFHLLSGTTIRWSGGDVAVTTGGNTFALGPIITRGKLKLKMGLQTDELQITLTERPRLDTVGGVSLYQAIQRGDLSGAAFRLSRAYSATPGSVILDVVPRFTGRINGILAVDAGGAQITAQSVLYLLDKPFPGNTYQPQCGNTLSDSMCQVSASSIRVTGTITSVTSQSVLQTSLSGLTADAYRLGRFRFTSGDNSGIQRAVKNNTVGGLFSFATPWPAPVVAGNAFEAFLGCDKKLATCTSKFSNALRFRGQPFIPLPETTT